MSTLESIVKRLKQDESIESIIIQYSDEMYHEFGYYFALLVELIRGKTFIKSITVRLYAEGDGTSEFMFDDLFASIVSLPLLEELNIADGLHGDSTCTSLVKAMMAKESFQKLNFTQNGLCDDTAVEIANNLKNNTNLTSLNLSGNHTNEIGRIAIINSLCSNKALKSLNLSWSDIESIIYNDVIGCDDLSSTIIDNIECEAIVRLMKNNNTLKIIDYGYNNIRKEDLISLFATLNSNKSLHELYITGIGDNEYEAIVALIKNNSTLQIIGYVNNNIDENGVITLFHHRTFREGRIVTGKNHIDESGLITLFTALNSNKNLLEFYIIGIKTIINNTVGNVIIDTLKTNFIIQKIGFRTYKDHDYGEPYKPYVDVYNLNECDWEDNHQKSIAVFHLELNKNNRSMLLEDGEKVDKDRYINNMIKCVQSIKTVSPDDNFELSSAYYWIKSNPSIFL